MSNGINILISFLAGLLSFFSPCVLALVPAYVFYIGGTGLVEGNRKNTWVHILLFTLGFSLVFILLGTGISLLGSFISQYRVWFNRIAGCIIIIFGLQLLGVLRIYWMYTDKHFYPQHISLPTLRSLLLGIFFGLGWTPCVGPILGSILLYVSTIGVAWYGGLLLFFYTLGLAIPLILVGLGGDYVLNFLHQIQRRGNWVELVTGILLVALGILLLTGNVYSFLGSETILIGK